MRRTPVGAGLNAWSMMSSERTVCVAHVRPALLLLLLTLTLAEPISHTDRKWWAVKRIARGVYYAPYFMYSLHIDLACKLQVETIASCATHAYPTSLFLSHRNMGCMWALRSMVQRARLCI